jgi:orotidine-5'-phosphate decarboxylase
MALIERDKSIIVAADVETLKALNDLVRETCLVEGVGGYKVGISLTLPYGLPQVVSTIREITTNLPIIYDHQKGATDIPEMGRKFAAACRQAGVEAVILFPFGGAKTEVEWIKACQEQELTVLVGAHMTQPEFLASEGGFVADNAPERIFEIAAANEVRDFVVPGNKPEYVKKYRELLEKLLGKGNFTLYAPGFVTQGGEISETGKEAGEKWHAIVGSAIYNAQYPNEAARKMTAQILREK